MVNKVMLLGNIGQNAEVKEVNGQYLIKLSLATTRKWIDKTTGEKKEDTQWHSVEYWSKSNAIVQYLEKGKVIYVEGEINYRKQDDKYYTNKRANQIQLT